MIKRKPARQTDVTAKTIEARSVKQQLLKRLNSFSGYITLPCRHPNDLKNSSNELSLHFYCF